MYRYSFSFHTSLLVQLIAKLNVGKVGGWEYSGFFPRTVENVLFCATSAFKANAMAWQ